MRRPTCRVVQVAYRVSTAGRVFMKQIGAQAFACALSFFRRSIQRQRRGFPKLQPTETQKLLVRRNGHIQLPPGAVEDE